MICANCNQEIDEKNYCKVMKNYFCSDECNLEYNKE